MRTPSITLFSSTIAKTPPSRRLHCRFRQFLGNSVYYFAGVRFIESKTRIKCEVPERKGGRKSMDDSFKHTLQARSGKRRRRRTRHVDVSIHHERDDVLLFPFIWPQSANRRARRASTFQASRRGKQKTEQLRGGSDAAAEKAHPLGQRNQPAV